MSNQYDVVDLYLGRCIKILNFVGQWRADDRSRLYQVYANIIAFSQYSFTFCQLMYLVFVGGMIEEMAEALYFFLTLLGTCFKMTRLRLRQKSTDYLIAFMEHELFKPSSDLHKNILKFEAERTKKISLFFLISANLTVSLWAIFPLLDTSGMKPLPFRLWMPMNSHVSPAYELVYTYQIVGILLSAYIFNGGDAVFLSMIMFGRAQMGILQDKVLNISTRIKGLSSQRTDDKKFQLTKSGTIASCTGPSIVSKLVENQCYDELRGCILHHKLIIEFIETVEATYHINYLVQISTTVGVISITLLLLDIVDKQSVQFFSMGTYMFAMLIQVYAVTWCGNQVTDKSSGLKDAFYATPWYAMNKKYRQLTIIVLQKLQKPIILKAGYYVPLSLVTFVSILRTSYSYYAVLQQSKHKKTGL